MQIDDRYRKDLAHGVGHGYGLRRGTGPIRAVIVHATHGRQGSALSSEAEYLRDSKKVSAHYLIGKGGEVLRILPDSWAAWHAGRTLVPFGNDTSIGIELHASATDPITRPQRAALGELLRSLQTSYPIPPEHIATHRAVALPTGRKSDPGTWNEAEFRAWVDRGFSDTPAPAGELYRATGTSYIRAAPSTQSARLGSLAQGATVRVTEVVTGERIKHPTYGTSDQWANIGYGYIWLPQLQRVGGV